MTCERCDGLMVGEQICDLQETNGEICANGYRCLLCGNIIDATILNNRKRSTEAREPLTASSPLMTKLVAA